MTDITNIDERSQRVDAIVTRLEGLLRPQLEKLRELADADAKFSTAAVISLRHSAIFHALGVRCEPRFTGIEDDSYVLVLQIVYIGEQPRLTSFVAWSQPYSIDHLPGYIMYESVAESFDIDESIRDDRITALFQSQSTAFVRGLKRGRPPSRWRRAWNDWRSLRLSRQ